MTLPASGTISMGNNTGDTTTQSVNKELGGASPYQQTRSLNDSAVRTLFGVASGTISMSNGYGKANRVTLTYTFSANTANASLNVSTMGGYLAGKSDITITVNSGVYLYANSVSNYGLSITGATSGDVITLVNNGYIIGQGGYGGGWNYGSNSWSGQSGGPALNIAYPTRINNAGYIAGGGGGGAGNTYTSGGGGAGGGPSLASGWGGGQSAGGGPGATGSNGTYGVGGAGGRILPGVGGGTQANLNSGPGFGGGSGGGGAQYGSGKDHYASGGGGGWGASGGYGGNNNAGAGGSGSAAGSNSSYSTSLYPGGAGGKAINTGGNAITWLSGTSTVYGAVG